MSNLIEEFREGKIVIDVNNQEQLDEAFAYLQKKGFEVPAGFCYIDDSYIANEGGCVIYNITSNPFLEHYHITSFKQVIEDQSKQSKSPMMERQYYEMVDIMIKIAKEK